MACPGRHIQISSLHRGNLSEHETESLLDHLEQCETFRSLDFEFKSVERFLATSADPQVPPLLYQRIVDRVTEEMKRDSSGGILTRFLAPFRLLKPLQAAVVIVAGLSLGVLTGSNLVSPFQGFSRHLQADVISLVFENGSTDPAGFDFVCSDDQGSR